MSKTNDQMPAGFDDPDQASARLTEMFVHVGQENRIRLGQWPAERAVFRKTHGVASGRLEMAHDIPDELKVGVFAHQRLDAWVRFSSDTTPDAPDLGSTVGIGIKLFGVAGPKALGDDGDTADFIMQNFPVFFVDDAREMVEFTYAGVVARDYPGYLSDPDHARCNAILNRMAAKVEGSVLTASYWALLPFRSGADRFVKYRLEPETAPENVANDDPNYLGVDLCRRLAKREYRFRFMVQLRTNPDTMPLEQATVPWPEDESPFIQVATLVLAQQDVATRGQRAYGEALAFNIWRLPPEQAPFGSIAEARKVAYAEGARVRHEANGQGLQDPPQPRLAGCPFGAAQRAAPDTCIVKAVIYPSIGVARVGSSEEWFIGPELPDPPPEAPGFYRDAGKKLKRQAARFRIYGVNAMDEIVRELTPANAKIEWQVQLANTKAAWYGFQLALDIPEAASAPPTTLRNAAVADRSMLAITPKARTVSGTGHRPKRFDDGKFMGTNVYLGEILTDDEGRLIVVGGHGAAASCDGSRAITFANNEGWHDDTSDGPVDATVEYDGQPLIVVPAWVVVAPPNYGPQRKSVRTMWDLMRDVAIGCGKLPMPARPSFTFDIMPLFQRLAGLQWVNAGFASGFGWKGAIDVSSPEALARLADGSGASQQLRRAIALQFRHDGVDGMSPKPWPWVYGDAMSIPAVDTPRQNTALSATQLTMLGQWAAGDFIEDYDPARRSPARFDDVPLAEQGNTLTRAALEFCLADAFHPGCEMTWPVRAASMYMAPFRFAHALDGWIAPGPGAVLTGDSISITNGPLYGQQPGSITRWMAVPWHTDTASCLSGYDKSYDPYLPTFWPARVPNQVLTKENYKVVMDHTKPMGERLAAFANRASWVEPLGDTGYTNHINNMIHHFDHLGVVEVRDGPADCDQFPAHIEVEDQHVLIKDMAAPDHKALAGAHAPATLRGGAAARPRRETLDIASIEKVRRFPGGLPR